MKLWVEVFLAWHKGADKFGDHTIEQVPLHLVAVFEHIHEAQPLQLGVAANGGEHVVSYGRRGAHPEMLDVAHLLDRSMVLFDLPMPVVQPKERGVVEGGQRLAVRQVDSIMANLFIE